MSPQPDVRVFPDPPALFRAAADEFEREAIAAVNSHGRFTVALSGGSTPKALYNLLATKVALTVEQNLLLLWRRTACSA